MKKNYLFNKRMPSWILLFFVFGMCFSVSKSSFAQTSAYTFSSTTGTYTPLSSPTVLATATGLGIGTPSLDDELYTLPNNVIPFNFNFGGVDYNTLFVNSNGYITFGLIPVNNSYVPISATTAYPGAVSAVGRDLNALFDINGNTGSIGYEVVGTAPNREFVIEWKNFRPYSTSASTTAYFKWNFQIRLHENNNINFVYDFSAVGAPSGSTAQVGLRGLTNADYANRSSSTSWTTTTAGTSNTASVSYTSTNLPPAGLTYTYVAPPPMAFASAQVLGITNRGIGRGTVNNAMAVLNLTTTGSPNPLNVTDIRLNTGATVLSNISNVKIYYTAGSTTFSTANQFGTTIATPTSSNLVAGTQALTNGNNYFWITYDVSATATVGDSLRAILPTATVGGVLRTFADSTAALPRGVMAPITGTVSVGTGQTYPNFGSLFSAMNTAGLSGNVLANVTSDIVEPGAAVLGQWTNVGGSNFTLTIRPSGSARKISGEVSNSGILVFSGSDNVTIDGRIGGTGTARSLTIENISTAGGLAILVAGSTDTSIGGCNDFTLRNTRLMAGPTVGTTTATVGFQTQGTGRPSNNMLITENEFVRAYRAIFIGANAPATKHLGLQITNNIIGSSNPSEYVSLRGMQIQNAYGAIINNNRVFDMLFNLGASNTAIDIASGSDSCIVSNNRIQNISSTSTGGWGSYGINMSAGNNHFVYNNEIANIFTTNYSSTSTTFNAFGIRITSGNGIRVVNNTVNMSANYGSVGATSSASAAFVMTSSVTGLQMVNNVFSNLTRTNAATSYHFAYWFPSSYNFGTGINSLDRNNAFVGTETYHYIGKTGTTAASNNYKTLGDWQTLSGRDTNTVSVNPLFFSASLGIPNAPAMNDAGLPYPGITTDVVGATRSTTTPDLGAFEYTPVATDLAALVITSPVIQGCATATQSGQLLLKNTGLQAINFSTNSVSVSLRMSGPASDTETVVINTGTLAVGDTLVVNFPNAFNMVAGGTYTFNASFNLVGDGFANNNNFPVFTVTVATPLSTPISQNFDSGTSTASLTNWIFDSGWAIAANHGQSGNGLYYNLWNAASSNPKFTMPKMGPVSATSNFNFSYRIVNYDGYPDTATSLSSADSMVFQISTDCGVTFVNLYKIDNMNHVSSTQWVNRNISLAAYAGQDVIIRFRGHWTTGDYYFDLDNVGIGSPVSPVSLIAPANNALLNISGAGSTSINARWTRASADPVTYTWLLSDTSKNFAAPLASFTSNNNGLDTVLTLNYYQIDALMASLGIPVGSTALATWTVKIVSGGSTTWAVDTFDIRLNRAGLAPVNVLVAPAGGTGLSSTRAPNATSGHTFQRSATITTASEFMAVGIDSGSIVTSMGFRFDTGPNATVRGRFRVWLMPTDSTTYTRGTNWNNIINGMMLVADDSVTISSTSLIWSIPFTTPVIYDGRSWNIAWDWNGAAPFATVAGTYACNNTLALSLVSGASATVPPTTLGATAFRPELRWGIEKRANDLDVIALYALGKNPRIYGAPERIAVRIRNNGINTSVNVPLTLTISGANTFTSSVNLNMAMDSITTIEFPYTASSTGFNNISVTIPADDRNLNNQKSWLQQVTDSIYSYADSVTVGNGAVGFQTGSGLLLNKYRINGTRQVKAARIRIGNSTGNPGRSVYAVVTNDTGLIVAQSAPVTLAATDMDTWMIFTFPVAPTFTDTTFMIGLAQAANATAWFPVAFQSESPTRENAYFAAALGGGGASAVSGFRLMIEAHVGAIVLPDTMSAFNLLTPANNDSINIGGLATQTVNFTWEPSVRSIAGPVTYDMTLETTSSNPISILTRTGLTSPNVSLSYAELADTLARRGVVDGGVFSGRWKVVANSGTLSKDANAKFNIKLRLDATSIEETELSKSIKLYPNPANTTATLEFKGALTSKMDVVIVNSMGQEMLRQEVLSATTGEVSIDVSGLQQGMYFVRITDGNQLAVKRLMIQR